MPYLSNYPALRGFYDTTYKSRLKEIREDLPNSKSSPAAKLDTAYFRETTRFVASVGGLKYKTVDSEYADFTKESVQKRINEGFIETVETVGLVQNLAHMDISYSSQHKEIKDFSHFMPYIMDDVRENCTTSLLLSLANSSENELEAVMEKTSYEDKAAMIGITYNMLNRLLREFNSCNGKGSHHGRLDEPDLSYDIAYRLDSFSGPTARGGPSVKEIMAAHAEEQRI